MMLSAQNINQIESTLLQYTGRVIALDISGEILIIKRQEAARPQFGYTLLNAIAKIMKQPLLCAVPAPGGAAAQKIEIQRLNTLLQAGIAVPKVRYVAPSWFAMTSAGTHSLDQLLRDPRQNQLHILETGLAAILHVHKHGQNLSQAFARNIMWQEGAIQFIDFEDDPIQTLPLAYAQSRDWLLYLHSTAHQIQADASSQATIWQNYLAQDHPEVRQLVLRCSQHLSCLRHLPRQRKLWGRDIVSLQGAGQVLNALKLKNI